MRELAHENARLLETVRRVDVRKLQEALAAATDREGQLQAGLIEAHDQLLRRDEQVQELRDEIKALQDEVLRLRTRLQRIMESPAARAWVAVRDQPLIRRVVAGRRAGYEAALQEARAASDRRDA
jgi:chromosome segregation ATPase